MIFADYRTIAGLYPYCPYFRSTWSFLRRPIFWI